jgi:hypothetical protein
MQQIVEEKELTVKNNKDMIQGMHSIYDDDDGYDDVYNDGYDDGYDNYNDDCDDDGDGYDDGDDDDDDDFGYCCYL